MWGKEKVVEEMDWWMFVGKFVLGDSVIVKIDDGEVWMLEI